LVAAKRARQHETPPCGQEKQQIPEDPERDHLRTHRAISSNRRRRSLGIVILVMDFPSLWPRRRQVIHKTTGHAGQVRQQQPSWEDPMIRDIFHLVLDTGVRLAFAVLPATPLLGQKLPATIVKKQA
jgi:hypothetical protein